MRRAAAFLFVAASAVGCTLLNPLGGYAGSEADAAVPGPPAVDASDAPPPDAGNDATVAFCAANPGHTVCSDFDEAGAVDLGWSNSDRE